MKQLRYLQRTRKAIRHAAHLPEAWEQQKLMLGRLLCETVCTKTSIASLREVEFSAFSQVGDDVIIQWLTRQLDFSHQTFIEFGVGDYRESNTRFLLMNNNWSGFVMDGSSRNIQEIVNSEYYWKYELTARASFIDCENIGDLIAESGLDAEVGILQIDLDGNDYWIWDCLQTIRPIVVIMEYNSLFGCDRPLTVPYSATFQRGVAHPSHLYFGASLAALDHLAREKGYVLIGCNSAGNNAYFVRQDKVHARLPQPSLPQAFVRGKFRDQRDQEGRLVYRPFEERVACLRGMPVWNVQTRQLEPF